MANPNYRGKVARLETDFDRWLARAQYREKHSQAHRVERMFGDIDIETWRGPWDETECRYLRDDEL